MSDPTRLSSRYTTRLVAVLSLIVLTCVAFWVPVPYATLKPGPAFDTLAEYDGKPMFAFEKGVKTYDTTGSLDFTTVRQSSAGSKLGLAEAVGAWFEKDVEIVPRSLLFPDEESEKESKQQSAAQMTSSKDLSAAVALRAAGYDVAEVPEIAQVVKGGAADGELEVGDVLTGIDGDAVATSDAFVERIATHQPGDVVEVDVRRDGEPLTVRLTTKPDANDPDVPRIGVTIMTSYDFPFEVTNNVGAEIGGPSAGTMFALAIYDRLTPGQLTGGERIAGTGTISGDGTVGPIGGVRQKMAGADAAGASIFLVPADNCAEAVEGDDHGLLLVRVETFQGAIDALEALADDPDAEVPSCR